MMPITPIAISQMLLLLGEPLKVCEMEEETELEALIP
jgi:hypothetical protein